MPRQTEANANNALGNLLQAMLGRAVVRSENTQIIEGHPHLRPDIVITAPGRSPVVIESEYLPAATVEEDALARLGLKAAGGGGIEAVIALRFPAEVSEANDLSAAVASAAMDYCVFIKEGGGTVRFPQSGWLYSSVTNLVRRNGVAEDKLLTLGRCMHWFDSATVATLVASLPQLRLRYLITGKRHD